MQLETYTIKKEPVTLHVFESGTFRISPKYLFTDIDQVSYDDAIAAELSDEKLTIPVNVLLVETTERKILIDTGISTDKKTGAENNKSILMTNLAEAGFSADDITDIIITHGHNDHIGGLLTRDDELFFPQAKIYLSQAEIDLWEDIRDTGKKPLGYIEKSTTLLEKCGAKLHGIVEKKELFPGITIVPTYGHTDGHLFVELQTNTEKIIHTGDLFVHPLHVMRPNWHVKPEMNPETVTTKRKEVIADAQENKILIFANHFPLPSIGTITNNTFHTTILK